MVFFITNLVYNLLIAFGVVVGAGVFAGIGALVNNHPPLKTMLDVARSIKIWAVAVALGGTFSSFEAIEQGLLKGEIKSVIRQTAYIVIALIGANAGFSFIKLIQKCGDMWPK
ncbi:YtrH family sporulation protein [Petroclostridium sp. X23]|uniref:YtrH family sporulation protein n=1 Tax=Petroclostridium sp. X23 TaxID=3045146 RepID=UPI0024ADFF63|nr:YtrH family sporulation protein [Petroclostridium sp. X23]WHH61185.1 YtrH family sporulation protein [Petroclostridium sp. X23]